MVHIDINPVEILYEYKTEKEPARKGLKTLYDVTYQRHHVIVYGVDVFVSQWERSYHSYDDYIEPEWRGKWEQFLGESFKRWIDESRTEEQEDGNSGD